MEATMSRTELVWFDGKWGAGAPLIGPTDHAFWMASTVFDGARGIQGHLPDLKAHCERAIRSALTLGMEPKLTGADIERLVRDGMTQLPQQTDYYIKMLFFCPGGLLLPDPATTTFALHIFEAPLPEDSGFSATISKYRRPDATTAPTDAKASCLYPNSQRAVRDALARGFSGAIMLDPEGYVAEFAIANIWIVRDGVALTPEPNGTFLNGITRQRCIKLLREDGITVQEARLLPEDVLAADEVFSTGNHGKILHCNRVEERLLPHGPVARRTRELYSQYTLSC
jgi:branched-chain amino acid aminotransferase